FFGYCSVVDINQNAIPTKHPAITGSQRFSAHVEPTILAIRSSKSADRVVRRLGLKIVEPSSHLERDVVGVNFVHPSPAEDFVSRRPEIFERTLVDVFNIALRGSSPHRCRNRLHQQTNLLLAAQK